VILPQVRFQGSPGVSMKQDNKMMKEKIIEKEKKKEYKEKVIEKT